MTIYFEMIRKAEAFAEERHAGQIDDSGKNYVVHVLQVGSIVSTVTTDWEVICASILHDTIEDTKTTPDELAKEFSPRVRDLVLEVTHEGTKDTGFVFPRLKSKEGILIKFADRLSNLSRMESWDEDRRQHYLNRSKFWKSSKEELTPREIEIEFEKLKKEVENWKKIADDRRKKIDKLKRQIKGGKERGDVI